MTNVLQLAQQSFHDALYLPWMIPSEWRAFPIAGQPTWIDLEQFPKEFAEEWNFAQQEVFGIPVVRLKMTRSVLGGETLIESEDSTKEVANVAAPANYQPGTGQDAGVLQMWKELKEWGYESESPVVALQLIVADLKDWPTFLAAQEVAWAETQAKLAETQTQMYTEGDGGMILMLAGEDPCATTNEFRIMDLYQDANGFINLTWESSTQTMYQVQAAPEMTFTTEWAEVKTLVGNPNDPMTSYLDTDAPTFDHRFYRVVALCGDFDGDGMPNGWEIQNGLNPLVNDASADLDGDDLSNYTEYGLGTMANNPDTDGDGMPDGWEDTYDLDPIDPGDATGDADGDTYTNLEEYLGGSNPQSSASTPPPPPTSDPVKDALDDFNFAQVNLLQYLAGQQLTAWSHSLNNADRIAQIRGALQVVIQQGLDLVKNPSAVIPATDKTVEKWTLSSVLSNVYGTATSTWLSGSATEAQVTELTEVLSRLTHLPAQSDSFSGVGTTFVQYQSGGDYVYTTRYPTFDYPSRWVTNFTITTFLQLPDNGGTYGSSIDDYIKFNSQQIPSSTSTLTTNNTWQLSDWKTTGNNTLELWDIPDHGGTNDHVYLSGYRIIHILKVPSLTVEWVEINSPLDDNPNTGGGKRIFPDKTSPTDSTRRNTVRVKATVTPAVSGVTLYFQSFDVDDPSTNGAPVDANGTNGGDNRGTPKQGTLATTSAVTDGSGIATNDFTVTMQPGDNFRVAVAFRQDNLNGMTDDNVPGNNLHPPAFAGAATPLLTVWRNLHVEMDSMAPVSSNLVAGTITAIEGLGTDAVEIYVDQDLDDGSPNLSCNIFSPCFGYGRFEQGSVSIGVGAGSPGQTETSPIEGNGWNFFANSAGFVIPFMITKTNEVNITGTIVEMAGDEDFTSLELHVTGDGPLTANYVGGTLNAAGVQSEILFVISSLSTVTVESPFSIPFTAHDDDDDSVLTRFPDTDDLSSVLAETYVLLQLDTPAVASHNNLNGTGFLANLSNPQITNILATAWGSRSLNMSGFWVAYFVSTFQYLTTEDGDPSNDTYTTLGLSSFLDGGALIFLGTLKEKDDPDFREKVTVVHELGHAFGWAGDFFPLTMCDDAGTCQDGVIRYTPDLVDFIRQADRPKP